MNNTLIELKIDQRLNKLGSSDFDNLERWQKIEAFNKGQVSWCRRQLHGMNTMQEGDEQSKRRIDDLQLLLVDQTLNLTKRNLHFQSEPLPDNYFEWKRISGTAGGECCNTPRKMVIYLAEEANVDELLRDKHKQPNLTWGETFCTLKGNTVKIFTNDEFSIDTAILTYYRQPTRIEIAGVVNPFIQAVSAVDVECEFKDDIVELFVDEAAKILAGDIESLNQQQTATNQVETNN